MHRLTTALWNHELKPKLLQPLMPCCIVVNPAARGEGGHPKWAWLGSCTARVSYFQRVVESVQRRWTLGQDLMPCFSLGILQGSLGEAFSTGFPDFPFSSPLGTAFLPHPQQAGFRVLWTKEQCHPYGDWGGGGSDGEGKGVVEVLRKFAASAGPLLQPQHRIIFALFLHYFLIACQKALVFL